MHRLLPVLLLSLLGLPHPALALHTRNVVLVTLDGLRPQEVFQGADPQLLTPQNVRNLPQTRALFWRDTPEDRREALLPFLWRTIAMQGQVLGDTEHNCPLRVTNGKYFSYPGYGEMLSGYADNRLDSNDLPINPNATVLEWLNARPGFAGKVQVVASWDKFPSILRVAQSGLPVNAGWMPFANPQQNAQLMELNAGMAETHHSALDRWPGVRADALTFMGALEVLKDAKPRVLYIALGETDEWAHAGRYDQVLLAARTADACLQMLWELLQSLPQYRNKTTLLVTTDHGRGLLPTNWQDHGDGAPGSELVWLAALGPDTPPLSCAADAHLTQSQLAATLATLLGENYRNVVPRAAQPMATLIHETRLATPHRKR